MKKDSALLKSLIAVNIFLVIATVATLGFYMSHKKEISMPEATVEPVAETILEPVVETQKKPSIKSFLKNAVLPVGSTMYVYGGGWNEEDTGAGKYAVSIGVPQEWKDFYLEQDENYDSSKHRYRITKGLDCSGYIGWAIYNTLEKENGKDGYVFFAEELADKLSALGFGKKNDNITEYKPGDIMSSSADSHAWICLGQCSDLSVVLVHSSPPGVRICGTARPDGERNSEAVLLAKQYMSSKFPQWYKKYPDCYKGSSYLTNYSQFRWYTGENGVMEDPDGYMEMTAEQILDDVFN